MHVQTTQTEALYPLVEKYFEAAETASSDLSHNIEDYVAQALFVRSKHQGAQLSDREQIMFSKLETTLEHQLGWMKEQRDNAGSLGNSQYSERTTRINAIVKHHAIDRERSGLGTPPPSLTRDELSVCLWGQARDGVVNSEYELPLGITATLELNKDKHFLLAVNEPHYDLGPNQYCAPELKFECFSFGELETFSVTRTSRHYGKYIPSYSDPKSENVAQSEAIPYILLLSEATRKRDQ